MSSGELPTLVVIRSERPEDAATIRAVNLAAFGQPDEADLVERLRAERVILLSLAAEFDSQVVGHVLFTRMSIETADGAVAAAALAPVAVACRNINAEGLEGG